MESKPTSVHSLVRIASARRREMYKQELSLCYIAELQRYTYNSLAGLGRGGGSCDTKLSDMLYPPLIKYKTPEEVTEYLKSMGIEVK